MGSAPDTDVPREHARRVRDLFDEVVDLDADTRRIRLGRVGQADPDLCREVQALLAAYDRADDVLRPLERPASDTPDGLLGRTVSQYRILERLGSGGMGVVYRAEDAGLRRTVALKLLPPELTRDAEARARLLREAQAAGALDHPNVCTVYDVGEAEDGRAFIAMAYYAGETLKAKVARGPLPVAEALGVAAQVAEGLGAAHEAGVVHRDVKPANVIVTERGVVKVLDFGIAKGADEGLTRAGLTLGTVAYMSPEQARGERVDHRTDLWALGVVLYEMLTGRRPFRGERDEVVLAAIRHDAPEPVERLRPEVPRGLRRVVGRCLEKDPAVRYQRAEELLIDLRAVQAGEPIRERARRGRPPRRRALAFGGAAALLVGLLAALGLLSNGGGGGPIASIAVLPVANLSGDPEQDYFADGMTDLLINELSRLGGLDRVIARTSVMRYRGTEKSPWEIGQELGVGALVEASVLREGERVRITVNLVEAETGRSLWSGRFERPIRDVLALQGEVAGAIAREIEVTLTPEDRARLEDAPRVDPEAFDLYVRGTQARYAFTRDDMRNAEGYFTRAIAEDPGYAPAYAGLAWTHVFAGDEAQARRFAEKALELDPNLAESQVALGIVRQFYDWDWEGAEEAFREAIRLNPGNAEAHHELSMLLMRLRRSEEALHEAQHTLYLAPMSARFQVGLGEVYLYAGRYDEAVAAIEEGFALAPSYVDSHVWLALAYGGQGRYERAAEAIRTVPKGGCHESHPYLGYLYAVSGNRALALAFLGRLEDAWREREGINSECAYAIAMVYAGLGERDEALEWLERNAAPGHWIWSYLAIDPTFRSLHGEPRFQALLEKAGLD